MRPLQRADERVLLQGLLLQLRCHRRRGGKQRTGGSVPLQQLRALHLRDLTGLHRRRLSPLRVRLYRRRPSPLRVHPHL